MFYIRGIENVKAAPLITGGPAAQTTTVTGPAVDFSATDDVVALVQDVGAVTGTTPSLAGKLQESADGSTNWTDCQPGGGSISAVTASGSVQVATYQRSKEFIRYVGTITGTTPSFTMDAIGLGQYKKT